MKIQSLYSSSSGNSCRVFNDTTSILIDCGVSMKKLYTEGEFDIDALFITHEHSDHVGGAGVIGRKLKCPIYIHEESYNQIKDRIFKNCDDLINFIVGGDTVTIGDFEIHAFTTRHDSKNGGMAFTITEVPTNKKFGYLTDTGSITKMMKNKLKNCDAYFLEAGHDIDLLNNYEEYDEILKNRIKSPYGHLSNDQIMSFVDDTVSDNFDNTQWIIFGHLSHRTNTPELVKKAFYSNPKFSDYEDIYVAPHPVLEII